MNFAHDQDDGPITVIVTRIAKKGRIKEFEDWMDGIVHESLKFEGHLGVNIIRPVEKSRPEYVIIFRFNTLDNLLKWEKSPERKDWLERSKNVVEGEDKVQVYWLNSGLPLVHHVGPNVKQTILRIVFRQ
jgi:uncharacterized protein